MSEPIDERVPGRVPGMTHPDAAASPNGASSGPPGSSTDPENPPTEVVRPEVVTPEVVTPEGMAGTIAALADEDLDAAGRRKALSRLAAQVRARGVGDLFKPRGAMKWIADAVGDVVPHLPIRELSVLREHFPGMTDEEIADRLVRNAALATAAVGAAGGGIAAVEWVATPSLLSAPVVLATETVAVVAVEIKLIAELHELYGAPIQGGAGQRTISLIHSWAQRRGVNPMMPGVGVAAVLGTGVRKELRDRLLKRFGRNLTSYGPMLTGAAVASYLNRRATIALAGHIRRDLGRGGHRVIEAAPPQP
jgi:hypothetical protein